MMYVDKPSDFSPKNIIVNCYVEFEGRILLLLRRDDKFEGNTWGPPAGKVQIGEKINDAVIRELNEETSIHIDSSLISYFKEVYVRYPNYDFVYHIFHLALSDKPNIILNLKEHKDFIWVTPNQALEMNLIPDEDSCIKLFFGID